MPRGFQGVRKASADLQARRAASGSYAPPALYFTLANGEEALVRFLEQDEDIAWCYVHEVPVEGRQWGRDVTCLNQEDDETPCPGCEKSVKKKLKGFINLVWYDAPLYKKDKEGKVVKVDGDKVQIGNETQVALWTSGVQLFEELDEINDSFKGLRSRRFKVKRKGIKLDTKYVIKPEDADSGPQPFTIVEKKLAEGEYDLAEFMKAPTYDEFMAILTGTPVKSDGESGSPVTAAKSKNPFMRNRS